VERDGKSLLEWIRIHSLKCWPGLAGPELGFSRMLTASVLRNDACLRLPARNMSIDFIANLPAKREENSRFVMIITNKLLKDCTLEAITFMKAEKCAEIFVQYHYQFHKFSTFVTLNKKSS
jgi:hypothetical protein